MLRGSTQTSDPGHQAAASGGGLSAPERPLHVRRLNFGPTFLNLLLEVGVERIMFSIDYPYGSMEEARSFLQHLPVSEEQRARIASGNAERLLKLEA